MKEIFITKEMDEMSVDLLHTLFPEIEDPYYLGKEHIYQEGEIGYFHMLINKKHYLCISDPMNEDKWFEIIKRIELR